MRQHCCYCFRFIHSFEQSQSLSFYCFSSIVVSFHRMISIKGAMIFLFDDLWQTSQSSSEIEVFLCSFFIAKDSAQTSNKYQNRSHQTKMQLRFFWIQASRPTQNAHMISNYLLHDICSKTNRYFLCTEFMSINELFVDQNEVRCRIPQTCIKSNRKIKQDIQ